MNWLSHIFISKNDIEYQLGNLLADPLKGKFWEGSNPTLKEGFVMHKKIDTFTDSHLSVKSSKARLINKKYLKGVIIDIVYDHLLLKNWNNYTDMNISIFIEKFYKEALIEIQYYPKFPKEIVKKVIESKMLTSYSTIEGLEQAFIRIDKRLSKKLSSKELASDYLPIVENELDNIEEDFNVFFPQLISYFRKENEISIDNHWLK